MGVAAVAVDDGSMVDDVDEYLLATYDGDEASAYGCSDESAYVCGDCDGSAALSAAKSLDGDASRCSKAEVAESP